MRTPGILRKTMKTCLNVTPWLVFLLFAAPVLGGELRGNVSLPSAAGKPVQEAGLNPYGGTLTSGQAPVRSDDRGGNPGDVVVYIENVPGAGTRQTANLTLTQINQDFEPHVLAVPLGTSVSFPNGDVVFHNVFSYSKAKRFDLGYYGKGKTKDVRFDKPGVVQIFCDIHSNMSAYVVVVDTKYVTQPDDEGFYVLTDVPPGTYQLKVWHPDLGERTNKVTITSTGITTHNVRL